LFSGKLVPRKGPDLLLEAVKELGPTLREQVTVIFLGEGCLREPLQDIAGLSPAVTVRFAGFQNQHSLSRFYHAADMLVMPSRASETWGLVVNEALHHGLPCVVSSAVGSAPDLVQEGITGATFESGSSRDLVRAILLTMDLLRLPELRSRCQEHVQSYALDVAARGIARAYWEALGSSAGDG
jgi:glycosyltransferase involved in cell wall biosynthesis